MSFQSTKCVFGSHVFFEQATKFEWSKVDVPDTVIDFFETDIFTCAGDGDIDPLAVPSYTAVSADISNLETVGIFERWQLGGHLPW